MRVESDLLRIRLSVTVNKERVARRSGHTIPAYLSSDSRVN